MGIHFGISQIVAYAGLYFLVTRTGQGIGAYYSQAVMLTGLTGLITLLPAWYFYRCDRRRRLYGGLLSVKSKSAGHSGFGVPADTGRWTDASVRVDIDVPAEIGMSAKSGVCPKSGRRRLGAGEAVFLLALGAAFAEYMNILVSLLTLGSDAAQEYNDSMAVMTEGKSFWYLVLWMGIVAPIAEEAVFRWLIYLRLRDFTGPVMSAAVSGAMFGVYHGNLVQGIYAGVLGFVFALFLEWSGSLASSVLLHIGANIFSLGLDEWSDALSGGQGALIFGYVSFLFLFLIIFGLVCFYKKYAADGKKRMV